MDVCYAEQLGLSSCIRGVEATARVQHRGAPILKPEYNPLALAHVLTSLKDVLG